MRAGLERRPLSGASTRRRARAGRRVRLAGACRERLGRRRPLPSRSRSAPHRPRTAPRPRRGRAPATDSGLRAPQADDRCPAAGIGAFVVVAARPRAARPGRPRPRVDPAARRAAGRDRRRAGRDPEAGREHGTVARADLDADQPERAAARQRRRAGRRSADRAAGDRTWAWCCRRRERSGTSSPAGAATWPARSANIHTPDPAAFVALAPVERRAGDRSGHVDAAVELRSAGAGRHAGERHPDEHAEPNPTVTTAGTTASAGRRPAPATSDHD